MHIKLYLACGVFLCCSSACLISYPLATADTTAMFCPALTSLWLADRTGGSLSGVRSRCPTIRAWRPIGRTTACTGRARSSRQWTTRSRTSRTSSTTATKTSIPSPLRRSEVSSGQEHRGSTSRFRWVQNLLAFPMLRQTQQQWQWLPAVRALCPMDKVAQACSSQKGRDLPATEC